MVVVDQQSIRRHVREPPEVWQASVRQPYSHKTLPAPNAQLPALVVVASMLSHFLPEPHYLFSTFTKHSTVT
jgi:hypothetical protein